MQGSQFNLPIIVKMSVLNSTRFAGNFMPVFVDVSWTAAVMLERTPGSISTKFLGMAIVLNQVIECALVNRTEFGFMKIDFLLGFRNWPQFSRLVVTTPGIHLAFSERFMVFPISAYTKWVNFLRNYAEMKQLVPEYIVQTRIWQLNQHTRVVLPWTGRPVLRHINMDIKRGVIKLASPNST